MTDVVPPAPHFEPVDGQEIPQVVPLSPPAIVVEPPQFGIRVWLLLSIAALFIARGAIYVIVTPDHVDLPPGLKVLTPGWVLVYGIGWILGGAAMALFAFNRRWFPPLFALAATPAFVWAFAYGYSAIHVDASNWNGVVLYYPLSSVAFFAQMVPPSRGWLRRKDRSR